MHRNSSVDTHRFAMIPRAEIPRSSFRMQHTHKTTFNASLLIPVYVQEVLPGDSFNVRMTAFGRLATPLFPAMDNLHLESFFFFVPCRLVWPNWVKMHGEQLALGDSISYVVPTTTSPAGGFAVGSLFDYFGLPCVGQVGGGNTITVNSLPLRAYCMIYNQWFRDENLMNPLAIGNPPFNDGPDASTSFILGQRGKRFDYFTGCLPWPQKGGTAITIPLGTSAPVKTSSSALVTGTQQGLQLLKTDGTALPANRAVFSGGGIGPSATAEALSGGLVAYPSNLYADLSTATAATINQLRLSFQTQKLLERDARGGTRYTEIIFSHFGVRSPDARLQRPEYLGGGHTSLVINPVAQTSATGLTGATTPLATLSGVGTALASGHGFHQSFTEHGYIIGIVNVRADLTYQQGIRKLWSRSTRYDFFYPVFSMLGEQAVLNKEIYADGSANDGNVFGYQERWSEYRYHPSRVSGLFRSTSAGTIDPWHFAERFTALPTLNQTFITDNTVTTLQRNLAVGAAANGQQIICDMFFDERVARPMPAYSVPGLIDHF